MMLFLSARVIVFLLLLSLAFQAWSSEFVKLHEGIHLRSTGFVPQYQITDTTQILHDMLTLASPIPTRDRLAVIILFRYRLGPEGHHRISSLHCSLSKLYLHLQPHTPMDVFVFVDGETIDHFPSWLHTEFDNLYIVPVDPTSWNLPVDLSPPHTWSAASEFNADYRSMGRWRLTFEPHFARTLGYKYIVGMDDDLFILQDAPFASNLVETFNQHNAAFALRNKLHIERSNVIEGLPELVRFWMVTRNVSEPWGELLDQFTPPTLDGISSRTWECLSYENSFHVINLDFWYEPIVQDFLNLVLSTDSDITQRWNEQAVMTAMQLLFLSSEKIFLFPQKSMAHVKVRIPKQFGLLQCEPAKHMLQTHLAVNATKADLLYFHPDVKSVEFVLHLDMDVHNILEYTAFFFVYNLSSCGVDTLFLSQLDRALKVIADPAHPKSLEYEQQLDAAYSQLFAPYFAYDGHTGEILQGVGCVNIVRLQLNDYYTFYCLYVGFSRPAWWMSSCEANRATALAMYDAMQ